MLECQRHLFSLSDNDAYLNGASRSPQLNATATAARRALQWREENSGMPIEDFFAPVERLKASFARIIEAEEPGRVALIPAASYGIATVAKNLPLARGQKIIVLEDQFPSNYYAWQSLCADAGAKLCTIPRPVDSATPWTEAVLEAIDKDTAAVAIANVHWADGSILDLIAIRRRTDEVGAWLIIDGTQSIGALPFDVRKVRPDALIAAGYKWLMGPYGCGYAYYGTRMDNGIPLEENWINRAESQDFSRLAEYRNEYRPLAARYSVGEHSNFLFLPMMQAALDQIEAWQPERIQEYTASLWQEIEPDLAAIGIQLPRQRAHHLIGLKMPPTVNMEKRKQELMKRGVGVSYRGEAVRVSPNVYNRPEEMNRFAEAVGVTVD